MNTGVECGLSETLTKNMYTPLFCIHYLSLKKARLYEDDLLEKFLKTNNHILTNFSFVVFCEFQAENIYNDEEPDTPSQELEPSS